MHPAQALGLMSDKKATDLMGVTLTKSLPPYSFGTVEISGSVESDGVYKVTPPVVIDPEVMISEYFDYPSLSDVFEIDPASHHPVQRPLFAVEPWVYEIETRHKQYDPLTRESNWTPWVPTGSFRYESEAEGLKALEDLRRRQPGRFHDLREHRVRGGSLDSLGTQLCSVPIPVP